MRYLLGISLLLLSILLVNCDDTSSKVDEYNAILTAHPWKYDQEAILEMTDFSQMKPHEADAVRGSTLNLANASIAFMPDSSVVIVLADGSRTVGQWHITEDAKMFYWQLSMAGGQPQYIREMSENRVVLENDPQDGFVFPKVMIPREETE